MRNARLATPTALRCTHVDPECEDLLIELAGTIDDEDTSLVERAEERANRFDGYRDNRLADASSAEKGVRAIMDSIPPG